MHGKTMEYRKNVMKTAKQKELEDLQTLYQGIPDETLKARIQSSGEWYIRGAFRYKRLFYTLSFAGIVIPVLVTAANGILTAETQANLVKNLTIICSALTALSTALLSFSKCREKWTLYRTSIEKIKKELVLYWAGKQEEAELKNLINRLEKVMEEEKAEWVKIEKKDEREE